MKLLLAVAIIIVVAVFLIRVRPIPYKFQEVNFWEALVDPNIKPVEKEGRLSIIHYLLCRWDILDKDKCNALAGNGFRWSPAANE